MYIDMQYALETSITVSLLAIHTFSCSVSSSDHNRCTWSHGCDGDGCSATAHWVHLVSCTLLFTEQL